MYKRLYQDYNFVFSKFNGLKLEKLIVCEDPETKRPYLIYIKVEAHHWHSFFIDADFYYGVFADEGSYDIEMDDEGYNFIDYTEKLQLLGQIVNTICCTSENDSCEIAIGCTNGKIFILRTGSGSLDSDNIEFIIK